MSPRWTITWQPTGKPEAVGKVSIPAHSALKAQAVFHLHNPGCEVLSTVNAATKGGSPAMQREDYETDVQAAYRHLSKVMFVHLSKDAEWEDLRKLLVEAYLKRAALNRHIMDAEAALGIKPE